ncbi:M15 family metallopeptidase [Marinobacter sp. ATCH36]|uniref:M15 family metallopeptidase n=1 Tax=Marinobacter sp. ATCH36 TaxID=2945106 RepID=UPI002021AE32|nr:M15 family metallopeptidase [Marinobacter sp. ATCH36]MCL7943691.1 M15 family metallopeptidase [Marinobacter sp. ATCH36]
MSDRLFGEDVLFFQRLLKSEGFYRGALDGLWGPISEAAGNAFDTEYEKLKRKLGAFDRRTEQKISSLSIRAQKEAREFMTRALSRGVSVKIISGTRTYDEQNQLFRRGRYGNPGPVITRARGGQSNHNFGIAWDIGIFREDGTYSVSESDYDAVAEYAAGPLVWGGSWLSFKDSPHYQLATAKTQIAWVRTRFEQGEAYVV